MRCKVVYVAHPARPRDGETMNGNLARAARWLEWLIRCDPGVAYIAPWIGECQMFDDDDPEQRALGLTRDVAVVGRCDAIVLCGGRVSQGMDRERTAAVAAGIEVHDLIALGPEPPRVRS